MGSVDPYVEAYKSMREGALYLFIAWILIGVGLASVIFSLVTTVFAGGFTAIIGALIGIIIVLLIGAIIALIGLWGKFLPGVRKLASINPDFSTASTLIYIGFFWGFIVMLVGVALLIVFIGVFLIIVAVILGILGDIGMLIMCLKLNDLEKNSLYLVAGILFILSIFLEILGFIGWILLYVALGDSINKRMRAPAPAPAPATSPSLV
ncbi:MAG: DUF973 family protein [Ignisphaera sp.]